MNRKLISKALSGIDDRFIEEAFVYEKKRKSSPERTSKMGRYENGTKRGHSRRLITLVAATCLVFALAITAYAANAFGIRDMFRTVYRDLPEEVEPYIQQHTEEAKDGDLDCQITESYCDSGTVMVTLSVSGGGRYILAPTDASPDSPVSIIGLSGEDKLKDFGLSGKETLEEFAKAQGRELLFVGATLMHNEELGIFTESQHSEHPYPNAMYILVQSTRMGGSDPAGEAVCSVYMRDADGNRKNVDVPFTLTQAEALDIGAFVPDNPNALPGITIGEATVTKEASGINIRWRADGLDQMAFNCKTTVEEITQYEGGGYVLEDDGCWYFELYMGQGEVTDTLTFHFTDWDDGSTIADVVFTRQK